MDDRTDPAPLHLVHPDDIDDALPHLAALDELLRRLDPAQDPFGALGALLDALLDALEERSGSLSRVTRDALVRRIEILTVRLARESHVAAARAGLSSVDDRRIITAMVDAVYALAAALLDPAPLSARQVEACVDAAREYAILACHTRHARTPRVQAGADAATAQTPRLTVDIGRRTVTLDGVAHDVASEQALRWVAVLASRPGLWVSARELETADTHLIYPRTSRLIEHLPESVRALIDSATGRGSRIRI